MTSIRQQAPWMAINPLEHGQPFTPMAVWQWGGFKDGKQHDRWRYGHPGGWWFWPLERGAQHGWWELMSADGTITQRGLMVMVDVWAHGLLTANSLR